MSKISEFVATAKADAENTHNEFPLGKIPNYLGQKIAAETGIHSIAGAEKILTAHAVRHAFVRHQAQAEAAEKRGQIGITDKDFEYLADILSSPADVVKGDKQNRKNNEILMFTKTIKGRLYHVLMSITRSKYGTTLHFNTMFIK